MGLKLARMRTTTHTLILMADQSPSDLERAVWLPFLNRPTAWHGGLARAAHLGDYRVLFVEIRRIARHRYEAYPEILSDEPRSLSAEALTRLYVERLEASLQHDPANWLGHTIAGNTAHQNKFSRPPYYTQLKYPHHPLNAKTASMNNLTSVPSAIRRKPTPKPLQCR